MFLPVAIASPTPIIATAQHASDANYHQTERRSDRSLIAFQSPFQHSSFPIGASTASPLFCIHDSTLGRFGRLLASPNNNCRTIALRRLLATPDDADDSNDTSSQRNRDERKKRSFTTARAGGRSTTSKKTARQQLGTNETTNGLPSIIGDIGNGVKKIVYLIVAVQILQSLFGFIFGGGGSDGSYVYYQSTVYETTSVTSDGKLERIRKESVKSNIPSLISGDRVIEDKNVRGGNSKSSSLLRDSPNRVVDADREDSFSTVE